MSSLLDEDERHLLLTRAHAGSVGQGVRGEADPVHQRLGHLQIIRGKLARGAGNLAGLSVLSFG